MIEMKSGSIGQDDSDDDHFYPKLRVGEVVVCGLEEKTNA